MSPLDVFWRGCEGPIRFGVNDCCMVVANTIVAAGGPDLMKRYRGRYRTSRGFVRAFRKDGFADLPAAIDAALSESATLIDVPSNLAVAVVSYPDAGEMVSSPAVFFDGFWCVRSASGFLALDHSTFTGTPRIYKVV